MIRNLKALGLALVAALVLGAIGAQGASAVVEHSYRFDAANETTVLTGHSESDHVFELGTGGAKVTCTTVTLSGTQQKGNILDTITLHPIYTSCKLGLNNVTVTTNGCNLIYDSDTTANPHFGGEHAAVSIECEPSHDIKIDAACSITKKGSPSNQSLHGVEITTRSSADSHSGKSAITLNTTIGKIHYETTGSALACNAIGKPIGTYTDGITKGAISLTGYEDNTGVSPTSTTTVGTTWHHSSQVNIAVSTPT